MSIKSIGLCVRTYQEDIDELVEVMYGGARVVGTCLEARVV
jgi:hypothetical protein